MIASRLGRVAGVLTLTLPAISLLGACASTSSTQPPAAPAGSDLPIPHSTYSPGPQASLMGAEVTGRLVAIGSTPCLMIEQPGSAPESVLWPVDFTAVRVGSTVRILDGAAREVATSETTVTLYGGWRSDLPRTTCVSTGEAFVVTQ